jgi:enoyl-CoA hydratase
MSQTEKIITRKDGKVAHLVFNNPERHNAMSLDMWTAMGEALEDFAKDDGVRVLVLSGAGGKAFISGADISRFASERANKDAIAHYNSVTERTNHLLAEFPKPTIAMVRGYCIGGGLGIALDCDMRICSDKSKFGVPAAKLGLGYAFPGIKRLVDLVGPSFAKEIFYTARQFDAAEAREMGLVNRVMPDAEVEAYVTNYAETIAGNAPLTINSVKFIVTQATRDESRRDLKRCADLVTQCYASKDYVEGRTAFMEKRKPAFTGS